MTTTNHTSPSGEDAANGAIGEREAFERELVKRIPGAQLQLRDADDEFRPGEYEHATHEFAWRMWQARAALTAEKVAAEPVAYYTDWPGHRVYADKPHGFDEPGLHLSGDSIDDHWHPLYAAPQQPAQSAEPKKYQYAQPGSPEFDGAEAYQAHLEAQFAEQDEPVDFVFPPMPPAIVMHDKVGPLFDRLSMQFYASKCMSISALQPAQTQVALTKEIIGAAWRECGARSNSPPDWALQFAQNIASALAKETNNG
jgi:hypothetical protein